MSWNNARSRQYTKIDMEVRGVRFWTPLTYFDVMPLNQKKKLSYIAPLALICREPVFI